MVSKHKFLLIYFIDDGNDEMHAAESLHEQVHCFPTATNSSRKKQLVRCHLIHTRLLFTVTKCKISADKTAAKKHSD